MGNIPYAVVCVSIPFKRESPFGLGYSALVFIYGLGRFNSLQTGKSFRTPNGHQGPPPPPVSIPFKRESPFGLFATVSAHDDAMVFQFPSNGKVLSDNAEFFRNGLLHKSFNSLQTGKSFRTNWQINRQSIAICFNSLQTGKSFRTNAAYRILISQLAFQFPSNGKVLSDW